jgi:hypothetical protein
MSAVTVVVVVVVGKTEESLIAGCLTLEVTQVI